MSIPSVVMSDLITRLAIIFIIIISCRLLAHRFYQPTHSLCICSSGRSLDYSVALPLYATICCRHMAT
ncbi:uncharacterized protein BDW47DRAFT_110427 [Aspergillus candidus]|uniref:Uncharacterized protein n=1 Tax=Aspergillus candidus TaxID=41067 RepID=A0A2I2F4D6_ASPCN|nr:hypothetical protein BDW47DRAFT_110427 [Aspergillus candidus]PLB35495.1 hypothetical protein BDW47DRAFT_110427 [Aspergillus candidus]